MNVLEAMWRNTETTGSELLRMSSDDSQMHIDSSVLYLAEGGPVEIRYQLELEPSWVTRKLSIQNGNGEGLSLVSDGEGNWFGSDGTKIEELNGAIDVDISATPFSNSLPINRHNWQEGQARNFEMVYVEASSLSVKKMNQAYTCEKASNPRVFRYQSENFESLIEVDERGLVLSYPGLFTREY